MKKFILNYIVTPLALFILFNASVILIISFDEPRTEEIIIKNISIAQERYSGKAEDALLSFLIDTTNSFHDRSNVAVWTLGQIKSRKALPVFRSLYLDDPSGVTCKNRHDFVICQRTLHNSILAIESPRELHADLNK